MKIAYRIQHCAGRDEGLARLLPRLPTGVEVFTDTEGGAPNPMRNYLRCLTNPPPGATHLCVIQDDALPCRNFAERLENAVAGRPADMISLFVGGLPGRTRKEFWLAQKRGDCWSPVYFREIHHVVALVWPVVLADDFTTWYRDAKIPLAKPYRSDDAVVGFWARTKLRQYFWATVPCLVEHPDDLPSTVQGTNRFGDKGRRAIAFIDEMAV